MRTKWLSFRIHRTNWNQCTAWVWILKGGSQQSSTVLHLSPPFLTIRSRFVIRPKGDVFLCFTTLLIESKCKKNSVCHQCCLQFYACAVYTTQTLISAILVVSMYNKTQNNFLPNIFKTDQQLLNHASVMAKHFFSDDTSAATSGSARNFLVPQSDEMIYVSIFI